MALPLAGQIIRASDVSNYVGKYLYKSVTETVTNSAAAQNDDDFFFTAPVGTYRIKLKAHASSSTSVQGVALNWTFSGTLTNTGRECIGPGTATVNTTATVTTAGSGIIRSTAHGVGTSIPYGIITGTSSVITEDLIFTVTVAGVMQLQWAQNTAAAATTSSITSGSWLFIQQIEPF